MANEEHVRSQLTSRLKLGKIHHFPKFLCNKIGKNEKKNSTELIAKNPTSRAKITPEIVHCNRWHNPDELSGTLNSFFEP